MDKNEMELNNIIKTCPNCKSVVNDDKFCRVCGEQLLGNDNKPKTENDISDNRTNYQHNTNKNKYIKPIIISIIVIIILVIIFILYKKYITNDKSNETPVNNDTSIHEIESNNSYKTFDFTLDDIMKVFNIKISECDDNSTAPYCEENSGTSCVILPNSLEQYVDTRVVYEIKTRKVISLDFSIGISPNIFLANNYGIDPIEEKDEAQLLGFQYTQAYLEYFLEKLGVSYDFSQAFTNPEKTRYIKGQEVSGIFCIENGNIGYIRAITSIGSLIRIIATDEESLYNLSVKELTNLLLDGEISSDNPFEIEEENVNSNSTDLITENEIEEENFGNNSIVDKETEDSREYTTLPDFTNYNSIEEVTNTIEEYNTRLNLNLKLNVVYDSQYPYGEIKSQSIGAGQKAYYGDTITVTVGNKIEESDLMVKIFPYNYLGLNMDRVDYVIPEELSVVPVTIIINGKTVYNEMVRIESRETKVEETFKVSLNTTVEIKVNGKTVFNRSKDFGAKAKTWTLDDMPEF